MRGLSAALIMMAALLTPSAAAEPQATRLVFRDAGPRSQRQVLATAALYARSAETINPSCAHAEKLVAALRRVRVQGNVPTNVIRVVNFFIQYGSRVLGVDSPCTTARKLSFAAIHLNSTAGFMYPTCRFCPRSVFLETTIHQEDRTLRPDICRWKLSGVSSTVRYLVSRSCV